jgi:uncharacterized protein YukE
MGALIYEDSLNKIDKHVIKHEYWAAHGIDVVRTRFDGKHGVPVDFGDYYAEGSNRVVDTKRSIDEIAQNINGKSHDRFKRECQRAQAAGYRLVVLIENRDGVRGYDSMENIEHIARSLEVRALEKTVTQADFMGEREVEFGDIYIG